MEEIKNEEVVNDATETETVNTADLYIDNINKIKANTVDKTAYDRLAEENKRLANALANGEYAETKSKANDVSIEELESKIKHCRGTNDLALMTNVLNLRSARLAVDAKDDIFVNRESAKASDYANAQAFADDLQSVIDSCNGDPMIFASRIRK